MGNFLLVICMVAFVYVVYALIRIIVTSSRRKEFVKKFVIGFVLMVGFGYVGNSMKIDEAKERAAHPQRQTQQASQKPSSSQQSSKQETKSATSSSPDMTISAMQMINDSSDNRVAAQDKYLNKVVKITDVRIEDIGDGGMLATGNSQDVPDWFSLALAFKNNSEMKDYKTDDVVTIVGKVVKWEDKIGTLKLTGQPIAGFVIDVSSISKQ